MPLGDGGEVGLVLLSLLVMEVKAAGVRMASETCDVTAGASHLQGT